MVETPLFVLMPPLDKLAIAGQGLVEARRVARVRPGIGAVCERALSAPEGWRCAATHWPELRSCHGAQKPVKSWAGPVLVSLSPEWLSTDVSSRTTRGRRRQWETRPFAADAGAMTMKGKFV